MLGDVVAVPVVPNETFDVGAVSLPNYYTMPVSDIVRQCAYCFYLEGDIGWDKSRILRLPEIGSGNPSALMVKATENLP